jgi:hypothetical protein
MQTRAKEKQKRDEQLVKQNVWESLATQWTSDLAYIAWDVYFTNNLVAPICEGLRGPSLSSLLHHLKYEFLRFYDSKNTNEYLDVEITAAASNKEWTQVELTVGEDPDCNGATQVHTIWILLRDSPSNWSKEAILKKISEYKDA